ncbi:hypothetical protein NMG60_11022021 [Bertholletia excelsa]
MVWFQCEDCGENLKKPKLPSHFRTCSAYKLSCIDCGQIFGQESVQFHTQCISEAEKYGPKGHGKTPDGKPVKANNDTKKNPDVDINVGLSERPPWFCSLCNTKATSKQTLLLHADGKKHRAKARAFHAANQQLKQGEEYIPNAKDSTGSEQKYCNSDAEVTKDQNSVKAADLHDGAEAGNVTSLSSKKRKLDAAKNGANGEIARGDISGELGNGEVIQVEKGEKEKTKHQKKKSKNSVPEGDGKLEPSPVIEEAKKKIKWKKLIKSALESNPNGALKIKKLRKLVLETVRESGFTEDESQIIDMIEKKINSSSRFAIEDKYVRLVPQN